MADRLRAIVFDVGGQPAVVADLNDLDAYHLVQNSLKITPPAKQPVMASGERKWAGSRQIAETHDNGAISWTSIVKGDTIDQVAARVTALLAVLERVPAGDLFIEWRPDGATYTNFYEVRATGAWSVPYEWAQSFHAGSWLVDAQIPVAPLARGHRMDIYDPFSTDTRGDYTYDSGSSSNETVSGGLLVSAGSHATTRRAVHAARGYTHIDSRQQIDATPGATIANFLAGVVLKRISPTSWIEAFVIDSGSATTLQFQMCVAGRFTALGRAVTVTPRLSAGTPLYLRGTQRGADLLVEYFTSPPGPLSTPAFSNTVTLTGADATMFGAGAVGYGGRVWVPQGADASLTAYALNPFWSGSLTLPDIVQFGTPVPGDAPALCDATITHSGGAANPVFAMLAWARRPGSGLAQAPWGILEAETAGDLSGWSVAADAGSRGGSRLIDTAAAASDVYTAAWTIDPALMVADEFDRDVSIELWALAVLASTLVSPTLTLSARPEDAGFGASRPTDEWGTAGKVLTVPSSGTVRRFVRLGTVRLLVDPLRPRIWKLRLDGAVAAGSSGNFGIDYLVPVLARQRALSPTSVADDAGYPDFLTTTSQASKTIRTDLSATVASPPKWGHPDHGLGGTVLELPPGNVDLLLKLSSLVPDDPTASAASEQLSHTAGIGLSVTPRYYLARSS